MFTSSPVHPGLFGLLLAGLLAACAVTPEPMTEEQRQTRVAADLKFVDGKRFAPTQPISLYKAMARAVAFNLQHSVRQIERDIAKLELEQANLEAWPDIAGDTGYNRDSVVTSTDTDRNIRTGSFGATWNLLDLGVSYARAQQSADRVLIAEERRRKGLQDIIRNVRLAYWKAVGAQRLMTRMAAIERDFSAGLAESRRLESNNVESRRRTVGFRRGLIDTVRQLISARKDYSRARLEFAQLINIRPGVNFTLQPPDSMQGIPALPVAVEEMASFALANRPELRVEDYNERVTDWESREALYSMFPGLDLNLTRNFSSDAGLVNTSWTGVGAQLGMNLFRLFSGPLRMQAAERRGELARRQRLALSVAVLAQVHIAFQEYRETRYQFRLARQISRSDRELSKMAMRERAITRGNRLDVVDVAARELRSEVEQHRAYVELRRAHGDLLHSLGLDVIPDNVPLDDIDGLRIAIRHTVAKWENLSEDTDPANDGTIEELVGQVFADIRRDTIVPGEPVGGAWPGPATTPEFEMQGMIGRAAGSVAEKTKGPTAPIIRSLAGLTPTEPGPLVIAPSDLADMALAMTDQAMAGNGAATAASGATGSTPAAGKVIEPPAALDVANDGTIEELVGQVVADIRRDTIVPGERVGGAWLGPATTPEFEMQGMIGRAAGSVAEKTKGPTAPIIRSLAGLTPTEPGPLVIAPSDLADMALAMTDQAMAGNGAATVASGATGSTPAARKVIEPPAVLDVADLQWAITSGVPVLQRSDEESVSAEAAADPPKPRDDQGLKILPPRPRKKRWLPAYDVQFGAYGENRVAQGLLAGLRDPRRFKGADRRLRVVRKRHPDKRVLYHVQYGAYIGWTAAQNACNVFARQGRKCTVVRHKVGKTVGMDVIPARILLDGVDGFDSAIGPAMLNRETLTGKSGPAKDNSTEAPAGQEQPGAENTAPALPHQSYGIQFGAYGEHGRAQALLAEVQNLRLSVDAGRHFRVVRKSHPGRQVLYHVQYGAYLEWTTARNACKAFVRQGRKCIVVRYKTASAAKIEFSDGRLGSPSVRLTMVYQVGPGVSIPADNGNFQQF